MFFISLEVIGSVIKNIEKWSEISVGTRVASRVAKRLGNIRKMSNLAGEST